MAKRQTITLLITVSVEADAAAALTGQPGIDWGGELYDEPMSGIEMAMDDAVDAAARAAADRLKSLGAEVTAASASIGRPYDDTLDAF